jgi:cobyrinic acid a,c-diamide synthase
VAVFKCGPDYLDPTYHARAARGPCHNLDGWMMGRQAVLETFAGATREADIALIEGVMGLYDGADPRSNAGSTAEIASWLDAPVLLVVDAAGMARSLAALVRGFAGFAPGLRLAGVLCNRVGSRGHLDLLAEALPTPPVLGGFPVAEELAFPERHLGLHAAHPGAISDRLFAGWARLSDDWLRLDDILAAACAAPPLAAAVPDEQQPATSPPPPARPLRPAGAGAAPRCRIGLAWDEALHFYYDDNLRRLERLGAALVRFSPLRDSALPDVDGLYLGGGHPELHAAALASNQRLLGALRAFAASGRPIYAECGGLMYLSAGIRTIDGQLHPLAGLIPGEAVMHERLQALGYVEVETRERSLLGAPGLRFRGHQFRYSELRGSGDVDCVYQVRRRRGGTTGPEGYRCGTVLATYVHAHWASNPLVAEGFVASCAGAAREAR